MNIAVIGHICRDIIRAPKGGPSAKNKAEQWGGIYYALLTLANLLKANDTIVPIFGVGKADYADLIERLSAYPNIVTKAIYALPGPTNTVHLSYEESAENRVECSAHISPPIPFGLIKPYLDVDGILINMISGFDLSLETLDQIRMEVRNDGTPIHFDFHSLTLGVDKESNRFRRPLTDWRRWCFMLNSVQLGEHEALGLTSERYDEPNLINQLMPLMVSNLLITRGSRGVTLIRRKQKKLNRHDVPGNTLSSNADPTGCGDVFGAAFLYRLIQSKDPPAAAEFANRVAAVKTTFQGAEGIKNLADLLARHFPEEAGEKGSR
jgi:sugar/nucleoside kinase (ribokinase family)